MQYYHLLRMVEALQIYHNSFQLLLCITHKFSYSPILHLVQDALKTEESYNTNEDLKVTLSQLASLSYHKNSKVALAARQVGGAYCYHDNDVLFTVAVVIM